MELATEPINELTVEMTARVIQDVHADVLCVVEAENRPSLDRFNQERIPEPFTYGHVMLIDGKDTGGIDVGIMFGIDHSASLFDETNTDAVSTLPTARGPAATTMAARSNR